METKIKNFLLIVVAVLLGFLVVRQFLAQSRVKEALSIDENRRLAQEVAQLYRQNQQLRKENSQLKEEKLRLTELITGREETTRVVDETIAKLKVISGEYTVAGEGVRVRINHYLALTQLVDLVNAIRNSGAEAISLNGQRIGPRTPLSATAENYLLEIIGDKEILAEALSRKGGILEQLGMGEVEKVNLLVLPAIDQGS